MATFIATLARGRVDNWHICKREGLWGVVGRGTNWRKNAQRLRAGDRIFVWKSGPPNGFIAEIEALGPLRLAGTPGVVIPWPDPDWFGGVFPIKIISEVNPPIGDSFPKANDRVGVRFGFNNTALQHIFEEICPEVANRIIDAFSGTPNFGIPHVSAPPPSPISHAQPFDVDPDLIDRGLIAHHRTIEAMAAWVRSKGCEPLLPAITEPKYDLAWLENDVLHIAEIKSVTAKNEESQLRLGFGQVLRYRQQLDGKGTDVQAWLVPEREPHDPSWRSVCAAAEVRLSCPDYWR